MKRICFVIPDCYVMFIAGSSLVMQGYLIVYLTLQLRVPVDDCFCSSFVPLPIHYWFTVSTSTLSVTEVTLVLHLCKTLSLLSSWAECVLKGGFAKSRGCVAVIALAWNFTFLFGRELVVGFQDVAFLPSRASFHTAIFNKCVKAL